MEDGGHLCSCYLWFTSRKAVEGGSYLCCSHLVPESRKANQQLPCLVFVQYDNSQKLTLSAELAVTLRVTRQELLL